MKTERRHELEKNELADRLEKLLDAARPYGKVLLGAVVAVGIVGAAYAYLASRNREAQAHAWNEFYLAMGSGIGADNDRMEELAEGFGGSPVGLWSRIIVADTKLMVGMDELFTNAAEGRQKIREAIEKYNAALAMTNDSAIQQRAHLGLGRGYEALNQLDEARQNYQALVDASSTAFGSYAEERLKDLEKPATGDFYDWFAQQDPQPATTGSSGATGQANFPLDESGLEDIGSESPFLSPSLGTDSPFDPLGEPAEPEEEPAPDAFPLEESEPSASTGTSNIPPPPSPPVTEEELLSTEDGSSSPSP